MSGPLCMCGQRNPFCTTPFQNAAPVGGIIAGESGTSRVPTLYYVVEPFSLPVKLGDHALPVRPSNVDRELLHYRCARSGINSSTQIKYSVPLIVSADIPTYSGSCSCSPMGVGSIASFSDLSLYYKLLPWVELCCMRRLVF